MRGVGWRPIRWRLLILLSVALVACGITSPSAPPGVDLEYIPGLTLDGALAYLERRTLACIGPAVPFRDPREWWCEHEFADGQRLEVRITADRDGVLQVVGLAEGLSATDAASFLASTVAGMAIRDDLREAVAHWASERAAQGGTWHEAGVIVRLQPHSVTRAVVITAG